MSGLRGCICTIMNKKNFLTIYRGVNGVIFLDLFTYASAS